MDRLKLTEQMRDQIESYEKHIDEVLESGPDRLTGRESPCFRELYGFAKLLIQSRSILLHSGELTLEELEKLNRDLYGCMMPEGYENSYVNPTVACAAFGIEEGRLISAIAAEITAAIPAVYMGTDEDLEIRLSLLKETFELYESASQGGMTVRLQDLRELLRTYYIRNIHTQVLNRLKSQLVPEESVVDLMGIYGSLPIADVENGPADSPVFDEECCRIMKRIVLTSGEFISPNELLMIEKLCKINRELLEDMVDTYVKGYIKGFEVTSKDISRKKTVELRFNAGFLPHQLIAAKKFRNAGLDSAVMRAGYNIFTGRSVDKNGFFGANPNPQFDLDHKDDLSLIIDDELNDIRLEALTEAYEKLKTEASVYGGPAVIDIFGEPRFVPAHKDEASMADAGASRLMTAYRQKAGVITNRFIPGEERSFTIIAYPVPSIADKTEEFEEIFDATVMINKLDYELYRDIQQVMIDELDKAEYVYVRGDEKAGNHTELKVRLHELGNPDKETNFENCVADVNIPVGEVFTSPVLAGTNGTLHVTHVYLNGIEYHDLEIEVADGFIRSYHCAEGDKLIEDNILYHHKTLPMGECAIGTNTTAYAYSRRLKIEDRLPILIAEKTGPHFAFGDTCYSHEEDLVTYNPDGKSIIARDNEVSAGRISDPEGAYFNCHTDITLPYDELELLCAVHRDGTSVDIIKNGRFVLPGTEELNAPFEGNF